MLRVSRSTRTHYALVHRISISIVASPRVSACLCLHFSTTFQFFNSALPSSTGSPSSATREPKNSLQDRPRQDSPTYNGKEIKDSERRGVSSIVHHVPKVRSCAVETLPSLALLVPLPPLPRPPYLLPRSYLTPRPALASMTLSLPWSRTPAQKVLLRPPFSLCPQLTGLQLYLTASCWPSVHVHPTSKVPVARSRIFASIVRSAAASVVPSAYCCCARHPLDEGLDIIDYR